MKNKIFLLIGLTTIFNVSCQHKKQDSNHSKSEVIKEETKAVSDKKVFENLDVLLSPFEDMTEFALESNEDGVKKSLSKIEKAFDNTTFERNLSPENYKILNSKFEQLKELIAQKKYNEVALASTQIFEFNVSNFLDGYKIENQINIEHLDYMGFKILALLNQEKIDWANIELTISNVQKKWTALSPNVADRNLKDSFNYLFKALQLSTQNKDISMIKILADMDLSLVDVLENNI
ncbi:hypothetical protein [Prolixibacter sp. SD074]|uniref:hypothetical protein n=1 Tax=Prolixibacter sp. SD074 TaxID=2652391 RepID=UPI00126BD3C4|nr:hypothetical protein [Prolixibacter sp. SD074]GET28401.1 hypothetical protein SD074_06030 [Prolixibacter sp. SD074]